MSLVQERLNISFLQTQGIYNTYAYNPENGDTSAACILADYFIQSRFIGQPGWIGGLIYCTLDDGFSILQIQADGTTAVVVGFGIVNTNTDFIPGKTVANYAALPAAASWPNTMAIALAPQGVILINYKPSGIWYSDGATWTYLVDYVPVSYASEITNVPAGDITAFDVQGAIDQLDILKVGSNYSTVSTAGSNLAATVNSSGLTFGVPAWLTNAAGAAAVGISAGTNSRNTGTVNFSNSNGVTFGMDTAGVVTASVVAGGGGIALSAGTNSTSTGTVVFSNANGLTFGMDTNAVVTGSYTVPTQTLQPAVGLATAQTNVTWTVNSDGISLNAGGYAGTGFSSTTTAGTAIVGTQDTNGLSIGVPAFLTTSPAQTNQNLSLFALGNTTQNSSTVLNASALSFNGIGGITAGYSNGSIQLSGVTTRVEYNLVSNVGNTVGVNTWNASNFDNIILSGGNNVTLSGNGNSIGISVGNYITTGRASNDAVGLNTAQTNVTWTVNSSGLSLNAAGYAGTGFTSTTTAGTAIVGTHNTAGLSIGVPTIITNAITTARASNDAVGLNSAFTAGPLAMTINSGGLSLNAGSAAGTTSGFTGGASISGSMTHNTAGLALSLSHPAWITTAMQSNAATISNVRISAGTTSNNMSALTFDNAGGITFGLNGSVITAQAPAGAPSPVNFSAGTTSNNLGSVVFSNSNGVGFGLNGSTITASYAGDTNSTYIPYYPASTATQTFGAMGVTSGSAIFAPVSIAVNVFFNELRMLEFMSFATSTVSGNQTISKTLGIFSNNAGTLSLLSSASFSIAVTNSSVSATISYPTGTATTGYAYGTTTATTTAQIHSLMGTVGNRIVGYQFGNTMSLSEGLWWIGHMERRSSSSANIGVSMAWAGNVMAAAQNAAPIGLATSAITTNGAYHFAWGPYTSTGSAGYGGTALPSSVFITGIANTMTIMPMLTFISTT